LYKTSLGVLEKGGLPLVLGGDHSLAAGSVAATADFVRRERKKVGLIWVDDPTNRLLPSPRSLQALRLFANQATAALANARVLDRGSRQKHGIDRAA